MSRKMRIGILTGGGDVPPLNALIASAQEGAAHQGVELIGFIRGWQGVIEKDWVNLGNFSMDSSIGGTILKSSRVNLLQMPDGVQRVRDQLRELQIEGLIVVGGEDTLSNSLYLRDVPQVLISKTIDNDVGLLPAGEKDFEPADMMNYFTLGYPTAARRISAFVSLGEGLRTTAYSHERLMVVESMGMHAGWLALSAGMGHPDFIVIPEYPLDYERFKGLVSERYGKQGHLIIVVAEGARWKDGSSFSADEHEKDGFGHPRFRGAAEVLAKRLKQDLKSDFDTRNVNAVNPSYLYRSGRACDLDRIWAERLGRQAVRALIEGTEGLKRNGEPGRNARPKDRGRELGMEGESDGGLRLPGENRAVFLTIRHKDRGFVISPFFLRDIQSADELHRFVDDRFYDPDRYTITEDARRYFSAIMEPLEKNEDYGIRR